MNRPVIVDGPTGLEFKSRLRYESFLFNSGMCASAAREHAEIAWKTAKRRAADACIIFGKKA